ncbi:MULTISPECIES: hypothetical protein [Dysgonomonas]|uniref:hypothetical protein n=1 Tax=Dysgonomonas TaxID=156973 RepID=UPI001883A69B|nr:hypothetical protein [Dysgonomonas sp. GY75]MBF0650307.1 hypothetical protein [Dysgonomonas sp. GY75]
MLRSKHFAQSTRHGLEVRASGRRFGRMFIRPYKVNAKPVTFVTFLMKEMLRSAQHDSV